MSYQPHSFVYKAPPLISIQSQCSLQRDSSLWGHTTSSYNIKPLPSIPSINHDRPSYNNSSIQYRSSRDISNAIEKDFQKRAEDYEKKAVEQKQENEYLREKIKNLKIKTELANERLENQIEMEKMKAEVELLKLQKTVGFCEKKFNDKYVWVNHNDEGKMWIISGIAGVTSRDDMVCGESGTHPLVPNYRTGHWEERKQMRNEDGSINLM